MKEIKLTQGKVALVDDCDFEYLNQWKWYAHKSIRGVNLYYAKRNSKELNRKTIFMHHVVIGKPSSGLVTDHIDGNGLNNQRNNLRIVTQRVNSQNNHNTQTSSFVGVTFHKQTKKWQAQIKINGKSKYLGLFNKEEDAHLRYKKEILTIMEGSLK